jgi:hypothetical protein
MRSNLVFRASDKVSNRFELCLLVSRSARAMNQGSNQMHDSINNAFDAIGKHEGMFTTLPDSGRNIAVEPVAETVFTGALASEPEYD